MTIEPGHIRREIIPRERRRMTLAIYPFDRREIATDHEWFCRHYASAETVALFRSRRRLPADAVTRCSPIPPPEPVRPE